MKKILLIVFLIGLVLQSCNTNTQSSENNLINGKNNIDEKGISLVLNYNKYSISKINYKFAEGFLPESVFWIDKNNLLIIFDNTIGGSNEKKYIYTYNIENCCDKLIYKGNFSSDCSISKVIKFINGNIGVRCGDSIFTFDNDSYELINKYSYQELLAPEVFSDCKKIAYSTPEGLFISNISNTQKRLITKTINNELLWPKLSLDDKLLYSQYSFKDKSIKINVYDQNTENTFEYDTTLTSNDVNTEQGNAYWFPDNQHILIDFAPMEYEQNDIFCIINTKDGTVKNIKEGRLTAIHDLLNDKILYVNNNGIGEEKLYILNYNTGLNEEITPEFSSIRAAHFSTTGEEIAFIGIDKDQKFNIYIVNK